MMALWRLLRGVERKEGRLGDLLERWICWVGRGLGVCLSIWEIATGLIPVRIPHPPPLFGSLIPTPYLETMVTQFTSDYLSTYLSLCPSPSDAVLSFGPMDVMLTPAQHYLPTRLYSLFPHPAQDSNEKRRYIVALTSR